MTDQVQGDKKKTPAKAKREIGAINAGFFGSPDNGTPVEQQDSTPVSQHSSKTVHQLTSKPALKKYTYYLTDAQDMKLEQIRLARRGRGVNVDKSALVREAIDQLQESEAQPVQPVPVREARKPVEVEAQPPVPDDLVSLQEFADLHAVNRNEAARLCGQGAISAIRQGAGRHTVIMLAAKGQRDFWVQFHETQGFRACDDCPHSKA
jgi:hypothetical protein